MSDIDSDCPFVDKKPQKQDKAKRKTKKRDRTPSEYDPEDEPYVDDGGEDDDDEGVDEDEEEESTPKKKAKGGSKKATPAKKAKTGGSAGTASSAGGSSSPGGKPVWTAKMKRELFSAMLGQPTKANCTEVAVKLGKEPSQCYDQWRRVLLPAIYKKIDEMG